MRKLSKTNILTLLGKLEQAYPDAKCALNFTSPFELLIATMLSAQSTDVRVNMVTSNLFRKYRTPADYAALTPEILQNDIKELGLFRAKSEHIIAASRQLLERFGGEVPRTLEELISLPGVGRKTANVVLSNAFGIPALAVDTHVNRVANRIGLAKGGDPDDIERQICARVPRERWSTTHHTLIFHGRQVCSSRKPHCQICPVSEFCQFYGRLSGAGT